MKQRAADQFLAIAQRLQRERGIKWDAAWNTARHLHPALHNRMIEEGSTGRGLPKHAVNAGEKSGSARVTALSASGPGDPRLAQLSRDMHSPYRTFRPETRRFWEAVDLAQGEGGIDRDRAIQLVKLLQPELHQAMISGTGGEGAQRRAGLTISSVNAGTSIPSAQATTSPETFMKVMKEGVSEADEMRAKMNSAGPATRKFNEKVAAIQKAENLMPYWAYQLAMVEHKDLYDKMIQETQHSPSPADMKKISPPAPGPQPVKPS